MLVLSLVLARDGVVGVARDRLEDIEKMRFQVQLRFSLNLTGLVLGLAFVQGLVLGLVIRNDMARDGLNDGDIDEIVSVEDKVEDEVEDGVRILVDNGVEG